MLTHRLGRLFDLESSAGLVLFDLFVCWETVEQPCGVAPVRCLSNLSGCCILISNTTDTSFANLVLLYVLAIQSSFAMR